MERGRPAPLWIGRMRSAPPRRTATKKMQTSRISSAWRDGAGAELVFVEPEVRL